MTEKTLPLAANMIDKLFKRLGATYGAAWTRQWADVPIGDVKSAWGDELASYTNSWRGLDIIAHALENLPERCPNVIEFKRLCRSAPGPAVAMLPKPKADPARVRAALAEMSPVAAVGRLDWARALQRKDEFNPSSVTQTIRKMYRDALGLNRVLPVSEDAAAQGAQA